MGGYLKKMRQFSPIPETQYRKRNGKHGKEVQTKQSGMDTNIIAANPTLSAQYYGFLGTFHETIGNRQIKLAIDYVKEFAMRNGILWELPKQGKP